MTRADRRRLLLRYARPRWVHLVALAALSLAVGMLYALQPLTLKLLVDNGINEMTLGGLPGRVFDTLGLSTSPTTIVVVAAVAAVLVAITTVLVMDLITLYWEWIGALMVRDTSRDVFDHLQRLSPTYHARAATGDSLSLVTTDASAVYTAASAILVSPLMQVVTIAMIAASAWRLDPRLTVIAMTMGPLLAVVSRWTSTRLKRRATVARRDQVSVTSFVTDVVGSLPLVQAYSAERENRRMFASITDRSLIATRRTVSAESAADSVSAVIGSIGIAVVLVVGGNGVVNGSTTVGELIVFLTYVRTMDGQFRALLRSGRQIRLAEVGLDRLNAVLLSEDRVPEPADPVPFPIALDGSTIDFDDVTFGYDDGLTVIDHVELSIKAGETIAVVGRTGAGKSTLVSLVARLLDPWDGRVVIDGVDVRDAALDDVRGRVSVVRQDPLILPISIADNIALGRPGADRAAVEHAAHQALADEFIRELPAGYDTVPIDNAADLSGGQRKRIALARAFLKDAPILILDEPTSALDPESESRLVETVERLSKGRTVIIVAHRLATVRRADRVVVVDAGKIVEVGTHQDLVDDDGIYAAFHRLHLSGSRA